MPDTHARKSGDGAAWIRLPAGSQPAHVELRVDPGHVTPELSSALDDFIRALQDPGGGVIAEATCTKVGQEACAWHAYCTIS